MSLVPAVRTSFTARQLVDAFEAAWRPEMGADPLAQKGAIAVLCAQVALETGNGAYCFNNNPGNYKAYAGVDAMPLKTTERLPDPVTGALVTRPMTCLFASYPSLADGVQRFVHLQSQNWPAAWHQAILGDPRAYAIALYAQKPSYYTADPAIYAKDMAAWFPHYAAVLEGDPSPTLPEVQIVLGWRGLELLSPG